MPSSRRSPVLTVKSAVQNLRAKKRVEESLTVLTLALTRALLERDTAETKYQELRVVAEHVYFRDRGARAALKALLEAK